MGFCFKRRRKPPLANGFTFVDYAQAAVNYNESIHGYYPIPNSEVTANPNLNN